VPGIVVSGGWSISLGYYWGYVRPPRRRPTCPPPRLFMAFSSRCQANVHVLRPPATPGYPRLCRRRLVVVHRRPSLQISVLSGRRPGPPSSLFLMARTKSWKRRTSWCWYRWARISSGFQGTASSPTRGRRFQRRRPGNLMVGRGENSSRVEPVGPPLGGAPVAVWENPQQQREKSAIVYLVYSCSLTY
jgi:hypothetical protein